MSAALLDSFDLLADSLGGVAKLRELILSLAVRGRLVPQDPNNEPASELLRRIRAEKDRLIKEGKIKRDKPQAETAANEKPHVLPSGWEWTRAADLCVVVTDGDHQAPPRRDEGVPFLVIGDVVAGTVNLASASRFVPPEYFDGLGWQKQPLHGDILYTTVGSYGIPIPVVETKQFCFQRHIALLRPAITGMQPFLTLVLKSEFCLHQATRYATGIAQKTVPLSGIRQFCIPLPPLAEQSRIVAKVEELMALCDRLEAEQGHATRVQGHWVDAALDQLAESADAYEFRRHWQHLTAHFDTLFTTPESIDRLDATLLQLAVRGKLVPQDPNDEPASELLKQIRAEKDRLIEEGKIKRDKPMAPISEDEQSYALPDGWKWGRFSDVILASDAGWSPSCESVPRAGSQWGVLKVSAVTWGEFRPNENKALPDHLAPRAECEVKAGDFLLSRANTEELVARSVVAWEPPERLMLSDKLIRLRLSSLVDKTLFCLINNATDSRAHYIANASGTSSSMKNVSREVILSLPVPIPPAQEQSRIVAKVEELQALTASLKARLTAARTKQAHLAEALIAEVV